MREGSASELARCAAPYGEQYIVLGGFRCRQLCKARVDACHLLRKEAQAEQGTACACAHHKETVGVVFTSPLKLHSTHLMSLISYRPIKCCSLQNVSKQNSR